MKFTTKLYLLAFAFISLTAANAQITQQDSTLVITDKDNLTREIEKKIDSVKPFVRRKADGIAAVIGDYLILDSDITKMREDAEVQGVSSSEISNCQLAGRIMENKLYAHHALLDSTIFVSDAEITSMSDQQLSRMVSQIGSLDKLLEFYRKEDEQALRDELFKINKERRLASAMQEKIIENVEITPEEVRVFFDKIPEDERPKFGDEVEIAQLVIKPEVPKEEEDKVVAKLNDIRNDIVNEGSSFATKAVLYSQDATSSKGGQMTITREDPLDKDFKQIAFSLREGEVSKPFKSQFGYHIVQLDKIRGQQLDIRHIIMIPQVTSATVEAAKTKITEIREEIVSGKITFDAAARKYSEEKETRGDGGQLINPQSGDTRFELTDIDPLIYDKVNNLKKGEVSLVLMDQTRTGQKFFKIITLTERYPEHIADYSKDYTKIKELALREKQFNAIEEWQTEKISETYVKINGIYRDCDFNSNWLKN
ncbi:periplasmic chaperone for outer membrane proteins SurA [Mesonia phycicola]|uniref:Periplasmic chaperone for outer membrane proteins SurA n=1 Tax=Mesonia phycicola TaxID=579105 RepID=A0A1M6A506_9FLAO|nr:peptidylprolyl isomerase [Mesonia phycicola]SHI31571.1 periplasmic chaperone for outer membrane proteins SurA [Mesonia phycicola]